MEKNCTNKIAIISIMTHYAKQIFDKTKEYEFRKSPIKQDLLNEKIYVYSAKDDKAIIGYFRVSDIISGNIDEILQSTGYNLRRDRHEIVNYYGIKNTKCFALHLYDIRKFNKKLTLKDIKSISSNTNMPQYIKYIYENDPLYSAIKEWDEAFSSSDNHAKTKKRNTTKN